MFDVGFADMMARQYRKCKPQWLVHEVCNLVSNTIKVIGGDRKSTRPKLPLSFIKFLARPGTVRRPNPGLNMRKCSQSKVVGLIAIHIRLNKFTIYAVLHHTGQNNLETFYIPYSILMSLRLTSNVCSQYLYSYISYQTASHVTPKVGRAYKQDQC